jgi:glutamyl/glutaminyl-tRNA synthetase
MTDRCRFAPSASGRAHPGTLLAGLLAWLDARSRGASFLLRIEDIDPQRATAEWRDGLIEDLTWFGLDWDALEFQAGQAPRHAAALDRLQALGRLYPCSCAKAHLRKTCRALPDGSLVYPGTCRGRALADWRACAENIRCNLDGLAIRLADESGLDLSQVPGRDAGDPVVRRRDGSVTYPLAVVADDAAAGVTRIVRGRDIAPFTAVQAALYRLLDFPLPVYRHHLLLLEPHGEKFAKFHGAVGADTLRRHLSPSTLCGLLAHVCGLRPTADAVSPAGLLEDFHWDRVREADQILDWDGSRLTWRSQTGGRLITRGKAFDS